MKFKVSIDLDQEEAAAVTTMYKMADKFYNHCTEECHKCPVSYFCKTSCESPAYIFINDLEKVAASEA